MYTKALLAFVRTGDSRTAQDQLKAALRYNKYVPRYLTGKKAVPAVLPDRIVMGGEDEGYCYAWVYKKS